MLGRRYLGPLALLAAIALTIGCAPEEEVVGKVVPRPTPTASTNGVGGKVTGGNGAPSAQLVLIEPDLETLSLNAPAADGTAPAGYAFEQALTARVLLTDGKTDAQGVTWSSADAERVIVTDGVARVLPGATGDVVLTATSVSDPSKSDSLTVHITTDGELDLSVTPALSLNEAANSPTTLHITRNGTPLPNQSLTNDLTVRLPAGTYTFQVTRTLPSDPMVTWSASNVAITPNGVTSLQGNLE